MIPRNACADIPLVRDFDCHKFLQHPDFLRRFNLQPNACTFWIFVGFAESLDSTVWQLALLNGCHGLSAKNQEHSKAALDRKSTRLNSSHLVSSYAVLCLYKNNS